MLHIHKHVNLTSFREQDLLAHISVYNHSSKPKIPEQLPVQPGHQDGLSWGKPGQLATLLLGQKWSPNFTFGSLILQTNLFCRDREQGLYCTVVTAELVWKVARYTSAAPMFFTEFEDYVDGGVLANNPCSYGLSAIQNFHR